MMPIHVYKTGLSFTSSTTKNVFTSGKLSTFLIEHNNIFKIHRKMDLRKFV